MNKNQVEVVQNNGRFFENVTSEYLFRLNNDLKKNLKIQSEALAQLHSLLSLLPRDNLRREDVKRMDALMDTTAHYLENINRFADEVNKDYQPAPLNKIYKQDELYKQFTTLCNFIIHGVEDEDEYDV